MIKPMFMQQMYGQMEKGLMKEADNAIKGEGTKLFKAYEKALEEVAPNVKQLSDELYALASKSPDGKFNYTMPDGVEINFDLQGVSRAKFKRGTENKFTQNLTGNTGKYDISSRAIMPNIMHSIDGYVMRRLANRLADEFGIPVRTVHDAISLNPKYHDIATRIAREVHEELLDSDILHHIMTQMGYEGKPLKVNTLTKEHLAKSEGKAFSTEHYANQVERIGDMKKIDNSRVLTPNEVMREYMGSGNYTGAEWNQIQDTLVHMSGYNTELFAVPRSTDDVYERAMVEALTGQTQEPIMPPKGVDKDTWFDVQDEIFSETRAKSERNPLLRESGHPPTDILQGDRKYFDKQGNWLGKRKYKQYQTMINEAETVAFKKQLDLMNGPSAELARSICGL